MGQRSELHQILQDIIGAEKSVYFQPPSNVKMSYPCIVYERDYAVTQHADNRPWRHTKRYQVTYIDRSPDGAAVDKLAMLPMCIFVRHFVADNLNHDVYNIYY